MDRRRKRELRDINLRVWAGAKDQFSVAASLDSSLKKNTAFIKRIRTGILPAAQSVLLGEIKTLSLQKYLSEIVTATAEGLSKLKTNAEVATGVEVVSALHQRFGPQEFTKQLAWLIGKALTSPDKAQTKSWAQEVREREEKDRLARHRVFLKLATEFWLCGILRSLDDVERPDDAAPKAKEILTTDGNATTSKAKAILNGIKSEVPGDDNPFPLEVLKELLGHDPELVNLPLAVLFVKSFATDILGLKSPVDESRKTVEGDGELVPDTNEDKNQNGVEDTGVLVPDSISQRFVNVLDKYLQVVKARVVREHKSLGSQNRRNAEAYVRSGEIFEDRQANFEKQTKALDKLISNAQVLCDILGQEMPDLVEQNGTDFSATGVVGIVKTSEYLKGSSDGPGIWEDEEERRYYENLTDLRGRVPAILLEDAKKTKTETDDKSASAGAAADSANGQPSSSEADDQSTAIANKTVGAQVDALLLRLPELQTKDGVDSVAHDFCFLNSKASRNRLIRAMQEIPKGRTDLLPHYARLAATLGQYMPDIVQGLISHLDEEFRSLQRRKTKDFLGQVRLINIRYLSELTKFGIVPEHVIFHCFKVSLDDFSRMNIEIIASFLENCGRYLLRHPQTAPRMASFLETLGRKKSAQHLGPQERMLLENALYYVDPPQRPAIQQKDRTPTELFIRQLVYLEMTKRNYMKILKTIRKLHWEETEVVTMLEKIFSKPWKVKFSNIHLLAVLLGALARYHQDFAITAIDNVLEQITLGLENNDFAFNQRRISEVKYLGELYNYKLVDSTVIFDTLYRILTFGHEGGVPAPDKQNPFDMPDDFFRIRLVCTVLDTCGICFDRGSSKKKLDFFLTFLQYYVLIKDPLPMEIDFLLQETFTLVRPQWTIVTDVAEAGKLFAEAVAAKYQQQTPGATNGPVDDNEDSASEDGMADDDVVGDADTRHSSDEEAEEINDEDAQADEATLATDDEEERIVVHREQERLDPEAEADFDREYEKMMAESLDSRKFERKAQFDVPLPIRRVQRATTDQIDDDVPSKPEVQTNTMAFSLMTKRGNRQQTRTIDLPSDSHFAVSMRNQQAAEREEQQRIKNLVLNYDLREDDQTDGIENDPLFFGPIIQPALDGKNRHAKYHRPAGHHHDNLNSLQFRTSEKQSRGAPRARRLNLADVDWYGRKSQTSKPAEQPEPNKGENTPLSDDVHYAAQRRSHDKKKPG